MTQGLEESTGYGESFGFIENIYLLAKHISYLLSYPVFFLFRFSFLILHLVFPQHKAPFSATLRPFLPKRHIKQTRLHSECRCPVVIQYHFYSPHPIFCLSHLCLLFLSLLLHFLCFLQKSSDLSLPSLSVPCPAPCIT